MHGTRGFRGRLDALRQRCARLFHGAHCFLALLLAVSFLQHSCVSSYLVSGNSMMPNYHDGDRVVVARTPSLFDLNRGDTVIARVQGEILIKRLVGLPGDTLTIRHGMLWTNGEVAQDPVPLPYRRMRDMPQQVLGEDEFFLLGDHRNVSVDSREFGPIHRQDILGRVILRIGANGTPAETAAASKAAPSRAGSRR